ncbi:ATP-grasp domain-containing protein [Roseospira goensis]|uniref:Biotin carboxylase n=1 Tax=Roseospira goensis TaxID=391922 RepID=A0A7W6S1K7_9PROT|nr:ATP-grasp domain-containing protein [Roseospira goensis]MBB4287179.1 biotin carboxylase [Roseospira goensis]
MGLDPFNLKLLRAVRNADAYAFHELLTLDEIVSSPRFDVPALLDKARATLRAFPDPVDAIVGYWDFPSVLMMPILRREWGLRGPSLESVLRCEHKYWSRLAQAEAVPDLVPPFALVDPFAVSRRDPPPLDYPFWLKPVTAHSSLLGYRIRTRGDFAQALDAIRAGIHRFTDPLDALMGYADLPDAVAGLDGPQCIAEAIISQGRQCTLEGYVFDGTVEIYGIVDSIRGRNRSSLERYEYPSSLPERIKGRMRDAATRVVAHIGLTDTPFNMEFFYDRDRDAIALLEINARISKSHSPLFDKVEGVPHKEVMIDVALGRRPDYPARRGRFRYAAKFMPRLYGNHDDWVVSHAPDEATLRRLEARVPGAEIELHVKPGMRLADMTMRDPYSYELATLFLGADSRTALKRDFARLWRLIDLRFDGQEGVAA